MSFEHAFAERARSPATSALVVVLACILVWFRTLHNGYVDFDTHWLVAQNPLLSPGDFSVLPTVFTDLSRGTRLTLGAEYLPFRDVSVLLDFALFGDWWLGHHAQNLFWYTVGCVAFLFVLRELLDSPSAALLAALFYAVHPSHLECVGWLASRKDVLGLAFFWLALWVGLRGGRGAAWSAVLSLVAIWSKNLTITLPVVLITTVLVLRRDSWRGRWWVAAPLHVAVVVGTLKVSFFVGDSVQMTVPSRADGVLELALLQGRMLLHYAKTLLWPGSLAALYPEPTLQPLLQWRNVAGALLYSTLLVSTPWLWWRGRPRVALGVAWGLITLAPVFQLVPLQNLVADRYLMLPLGGVALAVAAAVPRTPHHGYFAGAVVVALAVSSVQLSGVWRSTELLWQTAAERYPDHIRATVSWAGAVAARDPASARDIYLSALDRHPDSASLHNGLGAVLLELEDPASAERRFEAALSLDPTHKKALQNLIVTLTRTGRPAEAIPLGQTLTRTYPTYVDGWDSTATAFIALGNGTSARRYAEHAVHLAPYRAGSWCNLGSAAFLEDDLQGAQNAWTRCAALDPSNNYPRRGLAELERRRTAVDKEGP
jgi:Flp pilus assembly protein TadD